MPSIETMRGVIRLAYSGLSWKTKVDRMSDDQVCAVYHRFSCTGKLDEISRKKKSEGHVKQLSIFDKGFAPQ